MYKNGYTQTEIAKKYNMNQTQISVIVRGNINELSDMVPLDRVGAIKTFKKAGFIHTDKEVIEKVFDKESTIRQLLITKDMYFNKKESGNYE